MSNVVDVSGFEFWLKKHIFRTARMGRGGGGGEQRRRDNNYLSLMLHRSMCKSLKFPREPCWTEMRSLGWLSIKMSLMQPWKAFVGFKHWESVRLSGQPVWQRKKKMKKNAEMISHCFWRPIDRRPWGLIILVVFHSQQGMHFWCKSEHSQRGDKAGSQGRQAQPGYRTEHKTC